ncbi:MAG: valine--tRNA ligase [Thermodesulfobacteriota bacterium]|nr:valine--tRNA ligase [Thermodesulfobacteriota bacterium]
MEMLDKTFNPELIEDKWYQYWIDKKYFVASLKKKAKPYCIVIPPPNVTGSLHMGHALNNILQDVLIRYKRMQGLNTLWMPGTDHAGIATQNVVEKQLAEEGINRKDIGRERFIERVWKWKKESGGIIINQLKGLGASCDWDRERFTMDEGLSRAVREAFVDLYKEGLIYRSNYIINWCPRCHTALSDLEVEYDEKVGKLYFLTYPVSNSKRKLIIATTRPETMLGDTGVAVNPTDRRYKDLIGQKVLLPLVNREIPIFADSFVDMEFGTGVLKVTPAHDPYDFELGLKHDLDTINVMDEDARMNESAGVYKGIERFKCREKILADLSNQGFLKKIEDYTHQVGHCYRCKTFIEPRISEQWFVKTKPLAESAILSVKNGKTKIFPAMWEKTYFEWMENIRDWCISRQIWWGHQIPAWYCRDCGEIIVEKVTPERCFKCGTSNIEQESDVLDTWFSSSLWPFSILGWPEQTEELKIFYPTQVLVTGFDILFFWVARMMMMGLKFMNKVPFHHVYIHALVRDSEGQKMSKSKSNVVDPLIVMKKYGTDAFRFTLTALAVQGRDIKLSEERIAGHRNFANKIWNASRFVLLNIGEFKTFNIEKITKDLSLRERWILSSLHRAIIEVTRDLDSYRFNDAAYHIYHFIWHEFCDWYIEFVKPTLYNKKDPFYDFAKFILTHVLETILRLLHPFMPFITEEIWQKLPKSGESITIENYPKSKPKYFDKNAEDKIEIIKQAITSIRNIRGEMNIPPGREIEIQIRCSNKETEKLFNANKSYFLKLCKACNILISTHIDRPKSAAIGIINCGDIFIPLEGIIDFKEEFRRLEKELARTTQDLNSAVKKLCNEDFLKKAPQEIISKEQKKHDELIEKKIKLESNLKKIKELDTE